MPAKFGIDLFAIEAGPGPSLRREFLFFSGIRLRSFRLRKYPGDDGEVSCGYLGIRECLFEDLLRRPVKRPYLFLVVFVKRIIAS